MDLWSATPIVLDSSAARLLPAASVLVVVFGLLATFRRALEPYVRFAWNCFFKPLGKTGTQSERLDSFYKGQAEIYDATRSRLLQGRRTMLKLCASHLRAQAEARDENVEDDMLIWVDIGGGTGWNIEQMSKIMPLDAFAHIYLIDLCEPLLAVARRRCAAHGWTNVTVLCQDATTFTLPDLGARDDDPRDAGKSQVDLVTMSYSLSMIPNFYQLLDRVYDFLSPQTGFLGVADFYVSSWQPSLNDKAVGGASSRRCSAFSRWFWQTWFSFDHVNLAPPRRDYLEYKYGTVKCFNGRNHFLVPYLVQIPYYIWLGVRRERDTAFAVARFEAEAGNTVACPPSFPELRFAHLADGTVAGAGAVNGAEKGALALSVPLGPPAFPQSSFHYQRRLWRLPYIDQDFDKEFRTWIYSFTWEDPEEDMRHLQLGPEDTILVLTSAGDNALHYAIEGRPKRIHAVDMNACQGSLLEVKLAGIASLEYEQFWELFGAGRATTTPFRELLDGRLAPHLSSHAYQFWRQNEHAFEKAFYLQGYSGHALRLAQVLFFLEGVTKHVDAFCAATTLAEQARLWATRLRRVLLERSLLRAILATPMFTWNALGVPCNQLECFRREGVSALQYFEDTIDPIITRSLLWNENYHYYLCLKRHYSRESCPRYLQPDAFKFLKANNSAALDTFMLHTASIVDVCRGLHGASLTRAVLMDHLDWADPFDAENRPAPTSSVVGSGPGACASWVDAEVFELWRVVCPGGMVFWRSAAKYPWYNARFSKMGFKVEAISIRESGKSIDNVNMYASFYKATK